MRLSIRSKIVLFTIMPILGIYSGFMFFNVLKIRQFTSVNMERRLSELAGHGAHKFNSHLREAAQIATMAAVFVENNPDLTSDQIYTQLQSNLEMNPLVYGSAICFEPYQYDSNQRLFVRYVYRDGEVLQRADPSTTGYDYTGEIQEYWHAPRDTGTALWTAPYYDKGAGDILMSTYSVPFFRNGTFWGIATVDIPLEPLRELVNIQMPEDFDFTILTKDGVYVYSPHHERINKSIFEILSLSRGEDRFELAEALASGQTGIAKVTGWVSNEREWIGYAPVESAQWGFAVSIPERTVLSAVQGQIQRTLFVLTTSLILIVAGLWFISVRISHPITRLVGTVTEIATGNIDVRAEKISCDEIGLLAESFNEMTERISQREKALRESEQQFRTVFENSAVGMVLTGIDGSLLKVNRAFCKMLGFSESELCALNFVDITHPDDLPISKECVRCLLSGERNTYYMDKRYLKKDGQYTWTIVSTILHKDINNNPLYFITHLQDISERRQAEEALREREEMIRALIETSKDWIWAIDLEGIHTYCNHAVKEILGYRPDEIVGNNSLDLIFEDDRKVIEQKLPRWIQKKTGWNNLLIRWKHKGGGIRYLESNAVPILSADQEISGFRGVDRDITERKQTEEALQKSEQHYKILADNVTDVIWTADMNLRYTYLSPSIKYLVGFTVEEQISKTVEQMITPTSYDLVRKVFAEELVIEETEKKELHRTRTLEIEQFCKDGSTIWTESKMTFLRDQNNRAVGILGVTRDISERKRADLKLQERLRHEEYLALCSRDLLEGGEDPLTKAIGRLLTAANASRVYIFENFVDPEDGLCMRQIYEGVTEGVAPEIDNPTLKHLPYETGAFSRWSEALVRGEYIGGSVETFPQGERDILEPQGILSILILPIEVNGQWYGFIGFDELRSKREWGVEDVRLLRIGAELIGNFISRKRAEMEIRTKHEQLLSIFDSMDEVIYVVDPNTYEILYANEVIIKIWGACIGEKCYRALQNREEPCPFCTNHLIFGDQLGSTYIWEFQNERTQRWYRCIDRAIHWTDRRMVRFEMAIDISDQKSAEDELLKARKLESIGILAGGIAHDFNNLLMAIVGNISLAKTLSDSPEDVYEYLSQAEKASKRAQHLTQQLLTFSKGGAPVKENANVFDLVKDTATFSLRGSNVSCVFDFPKDLWLANIDKGQFSQVIQNLVINADQAMPNGGTIEIKGENITISDCDPKVQKSIPEGDYVKLSIKDQGIGISEENLQNIFDPYFTTKQKGSGLGLATTYSIIKNHDGRITVESQIGVGSTFILYLPVATKKSAPVQETIQEKYISGQGRILIMDDEKMIRDVAGMMLQQIGYTVDYAKDGYEAIEKYKKAQESGNGFNAVIMDLTIPGSLGGKETIQKLLEIDSNIKAVVSSGYSNDPIMADYHKYGFTGVIRKPYKIGELRKVLHDAIGE